MSLYESSYRQSLDDPETFWGEQSRLIDWETPPPQMLDYGDPPFARWFRGGRTNLCHNAVDRHLANRGGEPALIAVSTETLTERIISFAELHVEVQRAAGMLQALGVTRGDRVLIYMPMIAEAVFAMLACARLGAVHCVVFGGFASGALASRIEDAEPKVIVSADAGSRGGKVLAYKPLLDEAIGLSRHQPSAVVLVDRGLAPMSRVEGRDYWWSDLTESQAGAEVACTWLDATEPSYILYTSGTTGRPKGVQRDVGGYAVALAASMRNIYDGRGGETFFCTSDIGWVVGHSYIVYGPLLAGMATILYEGLPTRGMDGQPDGAIWWQLAQRYRVTVMFSAPTAIRVLKRQAPELLKKYDLSALRYLFLAGEPLDEPTARWIQDGLGVPVIDNYWQTESGWPIITLPGGLERKETKPGSAGVPMYGYHIKLIDEVTGEELRGANQKGVVVIEGPTPPGFMQTIWGDDERFLDTYWKRLAGRLVYSTFDWALRDEDGFFYLLGRTDDVINVAGHRLGTREIEECLSSHSGIAEVAVVGMANALKGQVPVAFVVLREPAESNDPHGIVGLKDEMAGLVTDHLGAIARPAHIWYVAALPKTRSGKLLRRVMQAVCERRETGDVSTLDDVAAMDAIREAMGA
ncbi:MAG: propionate--CoA ligase [Pigmentiphaga sp.]